MAEVSGYRFRMAGLDDTPPPAPAAPPTTAAAVAVAELTHETEAGNFRRDRLLSSLNLFAGIGIFLALPFALSAGAVFFLPVAVALVVSMMLAPSLEWLERRRVPSGLAAFLVLAMFLAIANAIVVAIVIPATQWFTLLPTRIGHIRTNLKPVLDGFKSLRKLSDQVTSVLNPASTGGKRHVIVDTPGSAFDFLAQSAPEVFFQTVFTILMIYFFLATYTRMREQAIRNRNSLSGSLRIARIIRDTVASTATYLLTVTRINAVVGAITVLITWGFGLPTPLMWGGLAALLNFIPYIGPALMVGLLSLGGLIYFDDTLAAFFPAGAFLLVHLTEANVVTPALVGRRLTINPLAILLTLSFWGWVWGTVGALISVPLLIIAKVWLERMDKPDILGFLFDDQTLAKSLDD